MNELITTKGSAINSLAERLQADPAELIKTLKSTAFKLCTTNEQFLAACIVANAYGLNPLLKEIYAFPGKGGDVIPMVPVDGWVSLVLRQKEYDGVELVEIEDDTSPGSLKAVTAKFYRKDTSHPVLVTEYMAECFNGTKEPWKQWPRRMLRHKAYIQGARIAFGLHGIYDEDEVERIQSSEEAEFRGKPVVRQPEEVKATEIPAEQPPTHSVPCCQLCGTEGEVDANGLCVVCASADGKVAGKPEVAEVAASGTVLTEGQLIPEEYWDLRKTHPTVASAMLGGLRAVKNLKDKKWYARKD